MTSTLWTPAREGILDGSISYLGATVKALLVRGYTFNAAHKWTSQVTAAGATIVATSAALTSKTCTGGTARADNTTWSGVAAGPALQGIAIVQTSAVTGGADVAATAQRIIAWIDEGTGLPATPNGQPITSTWNAGSAGIFRI